MVFLIFCQLIHINIHEEGEISETPLYDLSNKHEVEFSPFLTMSTKTIYLHFLIKQLLLFKYEAIFNTKNKLREDSAIKFIRKKINKKQNACGIQETVYRKIYVRSSDLHSNIHIIIILLLYVIFKHKTDFSFTGTIQLH